MNIHIAEQLTKAQMKELKKLYRNAFPASEKKPFWLIRKKKRQGFSEILGLVNEENRLVGEIITIIWRDLLLVDYFAIAEDVRGQGCGARALELMKERYRGKRLLLEIETPDLPCDNRKFTTDAATDIAVPNPILLTATNIALTERIANFAPIKEYVLE